LQKIRENRKFEFFDDLKMQIEKDVEFAKSTNDIVLTF
jgi:FAD synthase